MEGIILGCIILIALYAFSVLKCTRDQKLNMPPLVYYNIPIIGHTFSFMFNCEEFVKQCRKEYGDIFSLYIWGEVVTFVGKEHIPEVLAKHDVFDFNSAFEKRVPNEVMLNSIKGYDSTTDIRKFLLKAKAYSGRMQKSLHYAIKKYIDNDFEDKKGFHNFSKVMANIVSVPVTNVCIGEEGTKHDEIIETFTDYTTDVAIFLMIPPFLDFIFPGLQNYMNRLVLKLGLYNPSTKHQTRLNNYIKNQIIKRSQNKQKLGENWERPDDYLQDLIENEYFGQDKYIEIVDMLFLFIFASIHTTSSNCTNVIMDLASRPEYIDELYEEQLKIHNEDADENGILPFDSLNKMTKLDNFIRESLRLAGHTTTLQHLALKDYTFSNGLQVPKNHEVILYSDDIFQDESLQGSNPKSFMPFRDVNKNNLATKIGRDYVIFGGGKHACPGRFFAVNEIKFFMHNILLKYNIRTESGKIEEKNKIGPMAIPSSSGIIFERR